MSDCVRSVIEVNLSFRYTLRIHGNTLDEAKCVTNKARPLCFMLRYAYMEMRLNSHAHATQLLFSPYFGNYTMNAGCYNDFESIMRHKRVKFKVRDAI